MYHDNMLLISLVTSIIIIFRQSKCRVVACVLKSLLYKTVLLKSRVCSRRYKHACDMVLVLLG
jgi:hypothetical protein